MRRHELVKQVVPVQTQMSSTNAFTPPVPSPEDNIEAARAMPAEFGRPVVEAEKLSPPRRTLRLQTSDASTCIPSREQENGDDESACEVASCADTEIDESERRRRHSRRPRTGRRARARASREQWEVASRTACRHANADVHGDLAGLLLSCIAEGSSDEERRFRTGEACIGDGSDVGVQEVDVEAFCTELAGEDSRAECSGEEEVAKLEQTELGSSFCLEAGKPTTSDKIVYANSDDSDENDGGDGVGSCSDMNAEEEAELAGLAGHALADEVRRESKLLPAKLVLAMIRLQEVAIQWRARISSGDPRAAVIERVHELRARIRRVRAVTSHLSDAWDCPQYLSRSWAELVTWIMDGEDGPSWQTGRLKDFIEDLDEGRWDGDDGVEGLDEELVHRCFSLQRGWDRFVGLVDSMDYAHARKLYGEKAREEVSRNTQQAIQRRLATSFASRRSWS